MDIETQRRVFDETVARMREILFSKGDDYSDGTDRLSAFKLAGAICGITPTQHCFTHIANKVVRLGSLLDGKRPNHESINDTLDDLGNYTILLQMLLIDSQQEDACPQPQPE
jgi:hypothetical protein